MTTDKHNDIAQSKNRVNLLIDILVENERSTAKTRGGTRVIGSGVKCTTINFSIQDSNAVLSQSLYDTLRPILCQIFNITDEDFIRGKYKITNPNLSNPVTVDIKIHEDTSTSFQILFIGLVKNADILFAELKSSIESFDIPMTKSKIPTPKPKPTPKQMPKPKQTPKPKLTPKQTPKPKPKGGLYWPEKTLEKIEELKDSTKIPKSEKEDDAKKTIFCHNCGTETSTELTFCGKCGTNLRTEEPVPEPKPKPEQPQDYPDGRFPEPNPEPEPEPEPYRRPPSPPIETKSKINPIVLIGVAFILLAGFYIISSTGDPKPDPLPECFSDNQVRIGAVCVDRGVPEPRCPEGQQLVNGVCRNMPEPEPEPEPEPRCPEGQQLVNGVCRNIPESEPEQCPPGQQLVNGVCRNIPEPEPSSEIKLILDPPPLSVQIGDVVSFTGSLSGPDRVVTPSSEVCIALTNQDITASTFIVCQVVNLNEEFSISWTVSDQDLFGESIKRIFDSSELTNLCLSAWSTEFEILSDGDRFCGFSILYISAEPVPEPLVLDQLDRIILRGQSTEKGAHRVCNVYLQTVQAGNYEPEDPEVIYFGQMGGAGDSEQPFCAKSVVVFDLTEVWGILETHNVESIMMSYIGLSTENDRSNPNSCNELIFKTTRSPFGYTCQNPDEYIFDDGDVGLGTEMKYYFSRDAGCGLSSGELFNEQESWNEIDWTYKSPNSEQGGENDISRILNMVDLRNPEAYLYLCISFTDSTNRVGDNDQLSDNYQLYALRNIKIQFDFCAPPTHAAGINQCRS